MTRVFRLVLRLGAALQLYAQAPEFHEYQVKAALLYNFAKFVEWPPGTFVNPNDPIQICIVGQNPFGSTLEDMVEGKKIGDRTFAVRPPPDTQQAGSCQILFIGALEWRRTAALLEVLKGIAILTVGETDDFTSLGEIVVFKLQGPRVRILIARATAEHTKLRISSKLLSLAEIVNTQP